MKLRYAAGSSVVHGLNPLTKLIVLVLFSIVVFIFYGLWFEAASLALLLAVAGLTGSKAPFSLLFSRFLLTFIILLVMVQVLFVRGGAVYMSIPVGFFTIDITSLGIVTGLTVAARFVCVIFASGIFVFTTDPGELAYMLMKAGVPYRFGFMLVTALRFIPVFESEVNTVRQAQIVRGLDLEGDGFRAIYRSARFNMQPLIVSALSKVDVLAVSMEGRAFGCLSYRTFRRKSRFSIIDATIIILTISIFSLLVVGRFTGWMRLSLAV